MKYRKSFSLQAKDVTAEGKVRAVIATMNMVDKDGDVTLPGFFGVQPAVVVPVHDWDHVPIGKAMVSEQGNEAVADIQMNLDIQAAKDWLAAMMFDLSNGKPMMEWSYGFKILGNESGAGCREGEYQGRQVRFLCPMPDGSPGCKMYEVSPVLLGAGERTRTLAAKAADDGGKRFCDEVQDVHDAALAVAERGKSLADLRAKEGRDLSAANRDRLTALAGSLLKAAKDITALGQPPAAAPSTEARKEWARYVKMTSGLK